MVDAAKRFSIDGKSVSAAPPAYPDATDNGVGMT
jgi:hypothetical protein